MTRREFVQLSAALIGAPRWLDAAAPRTVRVDVFGLFSPSRLDLRDLSGRGLRVVSRAGAEPLRTDALVLTADGDRVVARADASNLSATSVLIAGTAGEAADCQMSVPSKVTRRFVGRVEVSARRGVLTAAVTMDVEVAVASVVAAELAPGPLDAARAQAVVARSFLLAAGRRHEHGAFCDTTHCQFLRDAPALDHVASRAATDTAGLVLRYRGRPIESLYAASCGGQTRTLEEAGFETGEGYPFFEVDCAGCRDQAPEWVRHMPLTSQTRRLLDERSERARLAIARADGWSAIPSTRFDVTEHEHELTLVGRGRGHGVGLCQLGATWLAERGTRWSDILVHYFPATTIGAVS